MHGGGGEGGRVEERKSLEAKIEIRLGLPRMLVYN